MSVGEAATCEFDNISDRVCDYIEVKGLESAGHKEYIRGMRAEYLNLPDKAFAFFCQSCKKEFPKSFFPLSQFFMDGTVSVDRDIDHAHELIQQGAKLGSAQCQYEMALIFEEKRMFFDVCQMLSKSAKGGHQPAVAAFKRLSIIQITAVLMTRLYDQEGNPKFPDSPFLVLPRDVLFYLFHFLSDD